MWIGSVGGGIWKTTDSGSSWQFISDFLPGLAIGCMVIDPANPDILYAGTGEGFFNGDSLPGVGILKSTDGGVHWSQIQSTVPTNNDPTRDDWGYVNRIAINPTNSNTILVATNKGIFRTVDGGIGWTKTSTYPAFDVKYHPTDGFKAVAGLSWAASSRALYSNDGGSTWFPATGFSATPLFYGEGRVELAYARGNPNIVIASVDWDNGDPNDPVGGQIWASTNGGTTYAKRSDSFGYLGFQGWYDNCIWIDPASTSLSSTTLVVGGVDLWRSTDGGTTLTKISSWQDAPLSSAHADHHAIVPHPGFNGTTNRTVFFGNDGGIYRTDNIYSVAETSGWVNLNNGLAITQFYGGATNGAGVVIGGAQDNGTLRTAGSLDWTEMFGGDGGFCAADPVNTDFMYGEYVYCSIHRSNDAGLSSDWIVFDGPNYLEDAYYDASFIAPFIIDPNNHNRILAGAARLWRSNNARSDPPDWFVIKDYDFFGSFNYAYISAIAVAAGNSDIVWVGYDNGDVFKTSNGTASTPTWTKVDSGLPNRYCTRIAIDPTNSNRVYVTLSGFAADNVWMSIDAGTTWTKTTGPGNPGDANTLPRAPVNSIVFHPDQADPNRAGYIYIGTDIGVFASSDYGATWSSGNDGPANVAVDELFWNNDRLIAVTHGRGMFEAQLCPAIAIATQLPDAAVGQSYNLTLATSAGVPPFTWSLVDGSLPPGISLAADGTLSGSLQTTGIFRFSIKVRDSLGCEGVRQYELAPPYVLSQFPDQATCIKTTSPPLGPDPLVTGGIPPYSYQWTVL
jgi:hypothetical protein